MKKLNLLFLSFLSVMVLVLVSCTPEPEPVPVGPSLSLFSGTDIVDVEDSVELGEVFKVSLNAVAGDELINRLTITENGVNITDLTRVTIDGDPLGSNPTPIADPNGSGFTWEIAIKSSDTEGTSTYAFVVSDAGGLSSEEVSVDITTYDSGTPVDESTMIMLLNQGGPSGTGGLDLHTGTGTGTDDLEADIRDSGIDLNEPAATNWIQKIGPINGSDLRIPDAAFVYDDIAKKEEIAEAFELGTTISESDVVEVGDQFLVLSGGTYFALIVTKIEITETDNGDFYEFSVKQ